MSRVLTLKEDHQLQSDNDRVVSFRYDQLKLVYTETNANLLAANLRIDWHEAVALRQKCESEELCLEILL